jgi:glutaminyl-peptide cyclotransferase
MLKALLLFLLPVALLRAAPIPEFTYEIVRVYPHDPQAFTEGLFFLNGVLYESTGLKGKSSVRKVQLATGKVLQQHVVPEPYFGEGIVAIQNRIIQLTYTSETAFVYDLPSFRVLKQFHYPGQGWALTTDGREIIMDDGTPELRFWNPQTYAETRRLTVTADGTPVQDLNELEWVKGEILANVWHTDRIARIDPKTGRVVGWIDLAGLLPTADRLTSWDAGEQVLNGIAYDAATDRLFVTGKYWPKLFEIRVKPKS